MSESVAADAELARTAAAGDRAAFAAIYDRYGSPLLGFCTSLLHQRSDAEDCLQDVFVIAATRLPELREPERLRSWLFAVARNECLHRIDRRRKEVLVDDIGEHVDRQAADVDSVIASALGDAPATDITLLLRDAGGGLTERDQVLLELGDRQQLSGDELAAALGVPRSTAYTLLARARTAAKTSIGALLVARGGRAQCAELDGLLDGWDGVFTPLTRKRVNRHIESCGTCAAQRDRVASLAFLLGDGDAFAAELDALRERILAAAGAAAGFSGAHTGASFSIADAAASVTAGAETLAGWVGGWPPADQIMAAAVARKRRRRVLAVLLLAFLLVGGGSVGWVVADRSSAPALSAAAGAAPAAAKTPQATVSALRAPSSQPAPLGVPAQSAVSPTPTPSPSLSTAPTPTRSAAPTPTLRPAPTATVKPSPTPSVRSTPTPTASTQPAPSPSATVATTAPILTPTSSVSVARATLTVNTANEEATITYPGGPSYCGGPDTCAFSIANNVTVTVAVSGFPGTEGFSSPASCTSQQNTCSFTLAGDTTVTLYPIH
jgi:RNA polymerase sigma factor (sigma-70 family)